MVSPNIYEKLIRPTEIELSRFFGGVHYWHSCGNTTPLQKLISGIPNLHMVHVSPWSSLGNAVNVFNPGTTAIEVDLMAFADVLNAPDVKRMEEKLKNFKEETRIHKSLIRLAGIEIVHDIKTDLENILLWNKCANKILL